MAEFYDEVLDYEPDVDYDVDVIFPDGTKIEMFLTSIPKIGDMIRGYLVNKIIPYEKNKEFECEARIELIRKEDFKNENCKNGHE